MTPLYRLFSLTALCLALYGGGAETLAAAPQNQGAETLDISAEESLEWHEEQQLYVARGKARAVRGAMVVEADLLTAHQRDKTQKTDGAKKPTQTQATGDIDFLTAEGNVRLYDDKRQVFGQKAVYDVDHGAVKITGDNLKLITGNNIVTAKESLEYYEEKKVAIARGHAIGEHGGSRIEADLMTAQFVQGTAGGLEMTEIAAKNNVTIITRDGSVSRGQNALYNVKKNAAVLSDNVRITKGETQLAGDKALVDFTSGQSRLINTGGGRVRALLPASTKGGKTTPTKTEKETKGAR